jgi:hypothetical protein
VYQKEPKGSHLKDHTGEVIIELALALVVMYHGEVIGIFEPHKICTLSHCQ